MPDFTLTARAALDGYAREFAGARLVEVADLSMVSIATPLNGEDALVDAAQAAWGVAPPAVGETARAGDIMLIGLAADQRLLLSPRVDGLAAPGVEATLGGAAYVTEQTDGWAMLRISGPNTIAALERICPIDLDKGAFPAGRAARTVMEHLSVVIVRESEDAFLLLSANSSARSFLHAVETSILNVT